MSDHHHHQKQPPSPGWLRNANPSPMRANGNPPPRLMSPAPMQPRQRSPTPTFNARHLSETPTFNPRQQSPTPPLRRMPPTPTGFTTVYESQRASSVQPTFQHPHQHQQRQPELPSPVNFADMSYPRPYRSTFSPAPTASTPCSIPPFSPLPSAQYLYMDRDVIKPVANDFYVVPLEPSNLSKNLTVYDEECENRPSTADIIAQQSQDYVDEKLAEYQATITLLQGKRNKYIYRGVPFIYHFLNLTQRCDILLRATSYF
jgi:hypothetical protein